MARNEEFDRSEIINAIWTAQGKVSVAAKRLGCDPSTIFAYANRYSTVQDAINGARRSWDEQLLDVAEIKLYEQVIDGRAWAVKYALATKGKDRGYVERQEIGGAGKDGAIEVRVIYDDPHPTDD
jgi:hypothetical protein